MTQQSVFSSTNIVRRFPQKGGWGYLQIDQTYAEFGITKPKWGLVPATLTVGSTTWKKSLLPFGDSTLFVALSKRIRQAEKIEVDGTITVIIKV